MERRAIRLDSKFGRTMERSVDGKSSGSHEGKSKHGGGVRCTRTDRSLSAMDPLYNTPRSNSFPVYVASRPLYCVRVAHFFFFFSPPLFLDHHTFYILFNRIILVSTAI